MRPRIYYRNWRGQWCYYDDIRDEPTILGLPRKDVVKWLVMSLLCALQAMYADERHLKAKPPPEPRIKPITGRNARCPCGSGLKYKRCCIKNAAREGLARQG